MGELMQRLSISFYKSKEIIRNTNGLTMVELVVATLVAAILMISISIFLPLVFRVYQSSLNLSNANIVKSTIESVLKEELQYARGIQILNNGKSISYLSSTTGDTKIYVAEETSSPSPKKEDVGLPVVQYGNGYIPLMYKEHIDNKSLELHFTYNESQHSVGVDVTIDHVPSSFAIELLNEEDDVQ